MRTTYSFAFFPRLVLLGVAFVALGASSAMAGYTQSPSLVVTNDAPPELVPAPISAPVPLTSTPEMSYEPPQQMPVQQMPVQQMAPQYAAPQQVAMSMSSTAGMETAVTRKINSLNGDLRQIEASIGRFEDRLRGLQAKSDGEASTYYNIVASINTELQAGTTPGNPLLVQRWNSAQDTLNGLADSTGQLTELSSDVSTEASRAAYLQEAVRATYGLSGAVKEDHQMLRMTEDGVNQTIINLNRLLTNVSDEINRRDAYLRAERANIQTLTLAIANGELYGQSLSNNLFKRATEDGREIFGAQPASYGGAMMDRSVSRAPLAANRRPLVVIRFDRPGVDYEQPLYAAVGQALDKYPSARFSVVSVSPSRGNPAEMAIAGSDARKRGEDVLRSLSQMGVPLARVDFDNATSADVRSSEVHIYIQ